MLRKYAHNNDVGLFYIHLSFSFEERRCPWHGYDGDVRAPSTKESSEGIVENPCLARAMRRVVVVDDEKDGKRRNVTMDGDEIGSFEACDRINQLVLAKDAYVFFLIYLFLTNFIHVSCFSESVKLNLVRLTVSTNLPYSIHSQTAKFSSFPTFTIV
jgi:hypothetical protein